MDKALVKGHPVGVGIRSEANRPLLSQTTQDEGQRFEHPAAEEVLETLAVLAWRKTRSPAQPTLTLKHKLFLWLPMHRCAEATTTLHFGAYGPDRKQVQRGRIRARLLAAGIWGAVLAPVLYSHRTLKGVGRRGLVLIIVHSESSAGEVIRGTKLYQTLASDDEHMV